MEHISLYRKWRPQEFKEVVGQRHVTDTLSNALSGGRLVHAYLFSGPRGTGKTSTARILAKAINCVDGPTATPCNNCEACLSISGGTALDVIEIDAASNRRIDEIRELLDKIPFAPTALRTKVYIIDEVHQLTPEASSALLKTLEEPPGHVVFVLATTEVHKLLPTIVSRCQRFGFSLVPTREISGLLEHIADREEIDIEPEALGMIAEHAHGSVRDAIGVIDQISNLSEERVTQAQLAQILGEVETELTFEMVDLIAERETADALALIGRMVESGKDPRRFVETLISHLRSLFLIQNAAGAEEIVEATSDHFQRLTEQANRLRRFEVIRLIERLGETHRQMRWNENPRLAIECALVKATRLDADISLEGLDFRIGEIERRLDALCGQAPSGATVEERPVGRPEVAADPTCDAPPGGKRGPVPGENVTGGGEGEEDRGDEKAPSRGGDRDKARRSWMAVLAEFKKQGQMKTYALLTKAKLQDVAGGEVVLGFPEDASFQMELLKDSEEIGSVEETWSRFAGQPVKIRLVSIQARKAGASGKKVKEDPDEASPGGDAEDEKAPGNPPGEIGHRATAPESDPEGSGKGGSREIASILKERFDGETVERKDKGKR